MLGGEEHAGTTERSMETTEEHAHTTERNTHAETSACRTRARTRRGCPYKDVSVAARKEPLTAGG